MNRQTANQTRQQKQAETTAASGLLQRKCACGNHTMAGGECEECSKNKRLGLQTKFTVNEPGDIYEQEADRIADQVMTMPANSKINDAPPRIQRLAGQSAGQTITASASVEQAIASPGRPLESTLRQNMEQRFGYDFSGVRVHTGASAEQSARDVNAHAYTTGQDIVFGASRYTLGTQEGRRLIAHELTHVVQQRSFGRQTQFIQLTPTEDFQSALSVSGGSEELIQQRLMAIIRVLNDSDLQEAEGLYVRLTHETDLRAMFRDNLPTYHADLLNVLFDRIRILRREGAERLASRYSHREARAFAAGSIPSPGLSPALLERLERLASYERGFRRIAATHPPGGRREAVAASLHERSELPDISAIRGEPEAGRDEREARRAAARLAAERAPRGARPSGRRRAAAEHRARRLEPEARHDEREARRAAARLTAERAPRGARPSGRRRAAVEWRATLAAIRSEPEQFVRESVIEEVMQQEEREQRIERGEIIWEEAAGIITTRLASGLLAIALIGFAVGAGVITGPMALFFAGSLASAAWYIDYCARREEIERAGYEVSIPDTVYASIGSIFGLSQSIEAITGERIGTGRQLSSGERTESTAGFADLVLLLGSSRAYRFGRQRGIQWSGRMLRGRPPSAEIIWEHRSLGVDETTGELRTLSRHVPDDQHVLWRYNPRTGQYHSTHLETGRVGVWNPGEAGAHPPPPGLPPVQTTSPATRPLPGRIGTPPPRPVLPAATPVTRIREPSSPSTSSSSSAVGTVGEGSGAIVGSNPPNILNRAFQLLEMLRSNPSTRLTAVAASLETDNGLICDGSSSTVDFPRPEGYIGGAFGYRHAEVDALINAIRLFGARLHGRTAVMGVTEHPCSGACLTTGFRGNIPRAMLDSGLRELTIHSPEASIVLEVVNGEVRIVQYIVQWNL